MQNPVFEYEPTEQDYEDYMRHLQAIEDENAQAYKEGYADYYSFGGQAVNRYGEDSPQGMAWESGRLGAVETFHFTRF